MNERESGFYWVRYKPYSAWEPAFWVDGGWHLIGRSSFPSIQHLVTTAPPVGVQTVHVIGPRLTPPDISIP